MKIARSEIEDGKHIAKLRDFRGVSDVWQQGQHSGFLNQAAELAEYQQLTQQHRVNLAL